MPINYKCEIYVQVYLNMPTARFKYMEIIPLLDNASTNEPRVGSGAL